MLSLLTEFLDWVLIFGKRHLRSALSECVDHYNRSRPYGSPDLTAPEPCERDSGSASDVRVHRRVQLSGLIDELLRGRVMIEFLYHLDYLPAAVDEGVNSDLPTCCGDCYPVVLDVHDLPLERVAGMCLQHGKTLRAPEWVARPIPRSWP